MNFLLMIATWCGIGGGAAVELAQSPTRLDSATSHTELSASSYAHALESLGSHSALENLRRSDA